MKRSGRVVWAVATLFLASAYALPMRAAAQAVANGPRVTVRADLENFSGTRRIRAHFRVDGDAYVVVGQIGADGVLRVIYPSSPTESGFVKGGSTYTTPEAFAGFASQYADRLRDTRFHATTASVGSAASVDSYDGGLGWLFVIASWKPLRVDQFSATGRWDTDALSDQEYFSDPRPAVYDLASTLAAGPDEPYSVQFARYYSTLATDADAGFESGYARAACDGFIASPVGFSDGFGYPMFYSVSPLWRSYGWSGVSYVGLMPGCYPSAFGIGYTIAGGYGYPFGYYGGGYPYGYGGYGYGGYGYGGYGGWWGPPPAPTTPRRPGFSPYLGMTRPLPHRQNAELALPVGPRDVGAESHFSPGGRVALPGTEGVPVARPLTHSAGHRMPLDDGLRRHPADPTSDAPVPSPGLVPTAHVAPAAPVMPERPRVEPRPMPHEAPRMEAPRAAPPAPRTEAPRMEAPRAAPPPRMQSPPPRMSAPPPRPPAPPPPPRASSGDRPRRP